MPTPSGEGDAGRASLTPETHARLAADADPHDLDTLLHVTRYRWALDRFATPGTRVVDLGCGSGYGAAMAHDAGCRVVAIDLDPRLKDQVESTGAAFVCADASAPDLVDRLGERTADLVLTMETIEHLEDYFSFVDSCAALVTDDGVVVVGTPNRNMTYERYPDRRHMDPSHVQEFTAVALRRTLERAFTDVVLHHECVAGFWDAPAPATTPSTAARIARAATPPAIDARLRRWRGGRGGRGGRGDAPVRRYDPDDVVIVDYDPGNDSTAFALVAVCRGPRRHPAAGITTS